MDPGQRVQNNQDPNQQRGQVGPFMITPEEARRRMTGDRPPIDAKKLGFGVVIRSKKVAIVGVVFAILATAGAVIVGITSSLK